MQTYDEMVDSGVRYIGRIPSGWNVVKFGYLYDSAMGTTILATDLIDDGTPVYSATEKDKYFGYIEKPKFILEKDSLVIPARGNSIGHVKIVREKSTSTQTTIYATKKRQEVNSKFIYYALLGNKANYFYFDQTAIPQITVTQVKSNPIALPSVGQQQIIADFLDQETAKIDNLIAKQEHLLELLEEKRRATITHAVTRGLNPNVELKETKTPWLIRAPEHFTMISMRYMLTFLTDYTANGSFASLAKNVNYLDEGFARLVRLTDLRKGLKNDGIYVDEDAYNFLGKSKLFKNDLLIANVGHYTGFVCKMPSCESPATLGPNMFLMRFDKSRYNNDFLEYILNTSYVQDQLKIKSSSAAQPKINKDQLRSTIVFMPEINEQNKIVELLNENGRKTDTLKQKIQTQIKLLKERRTSLISHAVTGKIKI